MIKKINKMKKDKESAKKIAEMSFIFIFAVAAISQLALLSDVFIKLERLAAVLPSVLVQATNKERQGDNLGTLQENELLTRAAKLKAEDMASKGYFSHTSPEGVTPWTWLNIVGYPYEKAGENLAVNFIDSVDVINAWMKSPSHRDNILSDKYDEIGIATAKGEYKGKEGVFVVQYFGSQRTPDYVAPPVAEVAVTQEQDIVEEYVEVDYIEPTPEEEIQQEFIVLEDNSEVLGEQDTVEIISTKDVVTSAPKNTLILILYGLLAIVSLKLILGLHIRHPRMIALAVLMIIILLALISTNSQLFIGLIK